MKNIVLLVLVVLIAVSCNQKNSNINRSEDEKIELQQAIAEAEANLFNDTVANNQKARDIIGKYVHYANEFPDDSLSQEYLFRAAEIALSINQPNNAVKYLHKVEQGNENYKNYPLCLFYLGYTYHYHLIDTVNARIYYERFLNDYPNHALATDVQNLLAYMGMTDEEIISMFEEMNQ